MKIFEENSEYINDNSILELIFVVADGEGSDVERQLVFSTIAQNIELQKIFQNVIKMNKVGELEIQNSTPPAHLTENLMRTLGFEETVTLGIKNELETVKSTQEIKKVTHKYSFQNNILYSIILLFLLFSSYFIGYNLGQYESKIDIKSKNVVNEMFHNQENVLKDFTETVEMEKKEKEFVKKELFENTVKSNKIKISNISLTQNHNKLKINADTLNVNKYNDLNNQNSNDFVNYKLSKVNPIFVNNIIKNNENENTKIVNNLKFFKLHQKLNNRNNNNFDDNQIDFLDLVLQFKNSIFKGNDKNSLNYEKIINNLENNDWIIQFNTKNDFQFSHDLFSENINNQLRSFELITLYKIDDNLFVGGKVGYEYLPIYYINGDNYNLTKNFYHLSGNIRYILPNQKFIIEDLIQPYINLSLGGASAGLYSGFGVGGNVDLYSNINFSFGVEFNNLTYFNNNGYFNINKTSSNIGLSYTF